MAVHSADNRDPFASRFPSWPLSHETWQKVYNASMSVNNTSPPLWASDMDPAAGSDLIKRYMDSYLNCGLIFNPQMGYTEDGMVAAHSTRVCEAPFANASGLLNNAFFKPE